MKRFRGLIVVLFFSTFFSICSAFCFSVHAQEKSGEVLKQLERKELIPPEKPSEPPVIEIEKDKVEEKDKDAVRFKVSEFKVEGATLLDVETIRSITAPYENKELTLSEISNIAEAITNEYRKKGYIIAYAFIPAQDIEKEIVRIRIIEGKIGDIAVTGNKHYSAEFIQKRLETARKDPSLKEDTLERALLILNEYPSLNVKASLKAGKEPGTADIIAAATDSRYISAGISYDNFGSEVISKHRASIWFDTGGLVADGDLLMLRGVTGLDKIDLDKLSYGRIEYIFPVDRNGTKLGFYQHMAHLRGQHLSPAKVLPDSADHYGKQRQQDL